MNTVLITEDLVQSPTLPNFHMWSHRLNMAVNQEQTWLPHGIGTQIKSEWVEDIAGLCNARTLPATRNTSSAAFLGEVIGGAWNSTASMNLFLQPQRDPLADLIWLLKTYTTNPNIRECADGVLTLEARLNEEEQLFVEIAPGDQIEAVLYVRGQGTLALQPESVPSLIREVIGRLDHAAR